METSSIPQPSTSGTLHLLEIHTLAKPYGLSSALQHLTTSLILLKILSVTVNDEIVPHQNDARYFISHGILTSVLFIHIHTSLRLTLSRHSFKFISTPGGLEALL